MQSGKKTGILTRRQFVAASAAGGLVAAVGCKSSGTGNWEFLSDQQAGTLAALCDQIVPADDFPSASQAGVLNYIDRQLVRHYRRHQRRISRRTGSGGRNQPQSDSATACRS